MEDSAFGPLVTGADVERWALDTLKLWTPEYLAWTERREGLRKRSIPQPRSWATAGSDDVIDLDRPSPGQLPHVLLISPGLADDPDKDGRSSMRARFALTVAVVVSARKRSEADRLAKLYAAAYRALLTQKGSLGGKAQATDWLDEEYDAFPANAARLQLGIAKAVFRVEVSDVLATRGGPLSPRPDPYNPYPTSPLVKETELIVEADRDELEEP